MTYLIRVTSRDSSQSWLHGRRLWDHQEDSGEPMCYECRRSAEATAAVIRGTGRGAVVEDDGEEKVQGDQGKVPSVRDADDKRQAADATEAGSKKGGVDNHLGLYVLRTHCLHGQSSEPRKEPDEIGKDGLDKSPAGERDSVIPEADNRPPVGMTAGQGELFGGL